MELDMTQGEVAKSLRKPLWFVQKCESGQRKMGVLELLEFARIYKKDPVHFLENLPRE